MDYNNKGSIMSKKIILGLVVSTLVIILLSIFTISNIVYAEDNCQAMYRLYNPISGEHFYTSNDVERNSLISVGWNYEGYGFIAANEGEPVYRLYNANSGDHHYTLSEPEKNNLIIKGWNYEGIGWYSNQTGSACEAVMYRLYNPNATTATHHYTLSEAERDSLITLGWKYEGTSWTSMHNVDSGIYHDSTWCSGGSSGETTCNVCGQTFRGVLGDDIFACWYDLPIKPCLHRNTEFERYTCDGVLRLGSDGKLRVLMPKDGICVKCTECSSRSVDGVNWIPVFEWTGYYKT